MPYAQDVWLTPIVLTASNNSFRVTEDPDGTPLTRLVTVAAGTYYLHADTALTAAGTYLGLYDSLATAINAAATETYSFEVVTPTISTDMTDAGIKIKATDATEPKFQIDWGHASFTMDPAWFGWRTGKGGLVSSNVVDSVTDGSDVSMSSNFTALGRWYSWPITANKGAADKRSTKLRNVKFSGPRLSDAVATLWDTSTVRRIAYHWLKSPQVFPDRADDTDTAFVANSGLAASDIHNGFLSVWESLADLNTVLITHNASDDLQVSSVANSRYEAVKLHDPKQAADFGSVYRLRESAGEYYDLNLSLWVNPDFAGYAH